MTAPQVVGPGIDRTSVWLSRTKTSIRVETGRGKVYESDKIKISG